MMTLIVDNSEEKLSAEQMRKALILCLLSYAAARVMTMALMKHI